MRRAEHRISALLLLPLPMFLSGCFAFSSLDQWDPDAAVDTDTPTEPQVDTGPGDSDSSDTDTDNDTATDNDSDLPDSDTITDTRTFVVAKPTFGDCATNEGIVESESDLTDYPTNSGIDWPLLPDVSASKEIVTKAGDTDGFDELAGQTNKWISIGADINEEVRITGSNLKITFENSNITVQKFRVLPGATQISIANGKCGRIVIDPPFPPAQNLAEDITISCMQISSMHDPSAVTHSSKRLAILNSNIVASEASIETSAIFVGTSEDLIVANNRMELTSSSHLLDLEQIDGILIQNNMLVHDGDTDGAGIHIAHSSNNAIIQHNLLYNAGANFAMDNPLQETNLLAELYFSHNTIYHPDVNKTFFDVYDGIADLTFTSNVAYSNEASFIDEDIIDTDVWTVDPNEILSPALYDTDDTDIN